ncbi:MAG: dicarboxylate/amino acid:cation symporter [Nitrospira sp. LK70]|nr:dicarboxylate/amino acid:cation symporter [Nitrospira sp. LK70]
MESSQISRKQNRFTLAIVVGLVVGTLLGVWLHARYLTEDNARLNTIEQWQKEITRKIGEAKDAATRLHLEHQQQELAAQYKAAEMARDQKVEPLGLLGELFLRLIQMIIAPLVFTTVVVGVAKLGDSTAVGRIGGKTLVWFLSASCVSLVLGLILVNILQPGVPLQGHLPDPSGSPEIPKEPPSLKRFFYQLIPSSVVDAMAHNDTLAIVLFSVLFGIATAALRESGTILVQVCEAAAQVILKITGYIMRLAPVAVFGAMAAIIAKHGPGVLHTYIVFIVEFYGGLLLLWAILLVAGYCVIGTRVLALLRQIQEPIVLAFSTSSSEAAFPKTMEVLERFGCKASIVRFVLPIGYSFNLDGSMMYMTFATLFIAQAAGLELPLATQMSMLLVLMLTSKGVAGVPRASLVVIAATLTQFQIQGAGGLALLLGIDALLDMGRSGTNVLGNAVATAVISKWEGALDSPQEKSEPHRSSACAKPHGSPPP